MTTYTSDCGVIFSNYLRTPFLYLGNTYNVNNSPYSFTLINIDCTSTAYPPNYFNTIRVFKNGIAIGDKTCHPFIDDPASCPTLFDGGNICISNGWMDCQDPNNCQYDVWYNEYTHLECVSGVCTRINGAGTDTCTTEGSTTECITTGSINCTSTPSGAQIWFDGINTDQVTPYTLTNKSAEMHNVTYKLTGYNDCGVNVTVIAGGTVNAPCTLVSTSQEITDVEVYYKVPWIYPKLYVDGGLYLFKQDFDKGLAEQGYPNYSVQTTVYNEYTHIITVHIKKMYSLSSLNNKNINTLFFPVLGIVIVVSLVGGYILARGLIALWIWGTSVIYAKNVTPGAQSSNRLIRVNVYKTDDSGNSTTLDVNSLVSFNDKLTDGTLINIKYPILANDGFVEFSLKNGFTPVLEVTSSGLVHELTQSQLTVQDEGNQTFDVYFTGATSPVQDLIVTPIDTTGNPKTCGNYMARYSVSGSLIGEGALQTNGKTATMQPIPGKKAYIIIISCDIIKDKITYYEFITASEPMSINVLIKSCNEAKNTLTIVLQRKKTSGIYEFPLPDSVRVTHPSGKILDLVSGTDYIPGKDVSIEHDEFEKGTHTVKIVRSDSTILTNTKTITFDTDCFESKQLTFDAEPIVNTKDINIRVIRTSDSTTIEGVNVYVDTDPTGYLGITLKTNNVGVTNSMYGISYTSHTFTLKRAGYKDITHTLKIDSSTPVINTLSMDSNIQVGTINTLISNLISNPSGDLIPNTDVKFEGELNFIDIDSSLKKLGLAPINIIIKEGSTIVKEYNVITDQQLSLSPGKFRTPTWTLPKSLVKKDLDVTAKFSGAGDYKLSSTTQSFHVTEGCCLNIPLIGCVASQSTCNALKTGAYIGGGLLIGYIGYKIFVKK